MTVNIQIGTVIDSIANININGVNVVGISGIPAKAMTKLPILFPRPQNLVTELRYERVSMGDDTQARMNVSYTLNYQYLHSVIGSGGGLDSTYSGLLSNLILIQEAILENSSPTGSINLELLDVTNIGAMADPSQTVQYLGAEISLRVLEFAQ